VKVYIKQFNVNMEVATNGIEFEVRSPDGSQHLGDLILTKTRLEWCNGQTQAGNGIQVNWQEFIDWMNS
jgi:hypothetical protein